MEGCFFEGLVFFGWSFVSIIGFTRIPFCSNWGRLGTRIWEFSNHTGHAESVLKPVSGLSVPNSIVSGHQETSLRMSSYINRDSIAGECNSGAMDFSWIPQRSFLSQTKNMNSSHATPVNSEMIDAQGVPVAAEGAMQEGVLEAKPLKVRKKHPSTRKNNHTATKLLRQKEPKKQPSVPAEKKGNSTSKGKREKKTQDIIVDGTMVDFSNVPVPVCSCTGVPHQCYRWGAGGWQSSCCTMSISEYPLPMSPSRPGARLAGRKMSIGAYRKLLHRLAAEGHDLSYAVDLKDHWARHGTNKFVTIK
ncbi:protein BASIC PENTACYSTEINE7 isoform X1 [Phoenix dactylifera]|uniref:GAGA-binding transcriptional activator n=1 Tax=Phoenix dactylifera TaxID=42345 RepID=A0A8B7BZM3_PHODC|nr:protein BASIC PENTACYSTEINE7 isoform X1 [Phoenix dactylifera]